MQEKLITSIKVGDHQEVSLEVLLAKLGIVETVMNHVTAYIEHTRPACENIFTPPDDSVLTDAKKQLADVYHAIKCACRGFDAPGLVRAIAETVDTSQLEGEL